MKGLLHVCLLLSFKVLNKLIARYRYLQKSFEDVMKKVILFCFDVLWLNSLIHSCAKSFSNKVQVYCLMNLMGYCFSQILLFLKGFTVAQRNKLAITTAIVLANGMSNIARMKYSYNIVKPRHCPLWKYIGPYTPLLGAYCLVNTSANRLVYHKNIYCIILIVKCTWEEFEKSYNYYNRFKCISVLFVGIYSYFNMFILFLSYQAWHQPQHWTVCSMNSSWKKVDYNNSLWLLEFSAVFDAFSYLISTGIALEFVTNVFKEWVNERDFSHLSSSLKKAELENKILVRIVWI